MKSNLVLSLLAVILVLAPGLSNVQSGGQNILFGDFKIDESQTSGITPISFDIILYTTGGNLVGRQSVTNNGRYRFMNLRNGEYYLVVEMENSEVARLSVNVASPTKTDIRQDIELEWRGNLVGKNNNKPVAATADFYERTATNKKRFAKAEKAIDEKNYAEAITLFRQILGEDQRDYQSWSELGTIYLVQRDFAEAERAYLRAADANPAFFQCLFNLGKLRMVEKKFETAVEPLSQAVKLKPASPEANYFLGEAYLQIKKGSKAVVYLYEALKLDPVGMAEAHLRLAALYNGAGVKDKAAAEYTEFLKKKPNYPDRTKLEQYIAQHQKQ
jgi:Flp pilus assembly protein TadD